jgi:hypothetical protein
MLLHDIGKGRGAAEPHAESSGRIAALVLDQDVTAIRALSGRERRLIVWGVRHHDVPGNVYTGERVASYVDEITAAGRDAGGDALPAFRPARGLGLRLLQLVALCDLRGDSGRRRVGRVSHRREGEILAVAHADHDGLTPDS